MNGAGSVSKARAPGDRPARTEDEAYAKVVEIFERYKVLSDRLAKAQRHNGGGDGGGKERGNDALPELFDTHLMLSFFPTNHSPAPNLQLIHAHPSGRTLFRLASLPTRFTNLNSVLHGGAYATIFDMLTTVALGPLSYKGYWEFLGGVTRSLNVSYLRPVRAGETVYVRAWVVQVGGRMALIRGEMFTREGERENREVVCATVEHHKVNVKMREEHEVKGNGEGEGEGESINGEAKKKTKSKL